MFYTIYKTRNTKNGKFYIGKHQTDNLEDGYLGSGKALLKAIKLYGRDAFKKEILFIFNDESSMNDKEKELVTEDLVNDKNSYNLGIGGEGGPHFKNKKHSLVTIEKMKKTMRSNPIFIDACRKSGIKNGHASKGRKLSAKARENIRNGRLGKKMSEETKAKISASLKAK